MPQYIALIICAYILIASGVLTGPCRAMGISRFKLSYALLCTLALSIFQLRVGVEANINLGAVALAFMPGLMVGKGEDAAGIGTVMLVSVMIALLKYSGEMYGAGSGLLCGLMAGATGLVLSDSPAAAAFAAGGIPLVTAVLEAFIWLTVSGYASVEIGHDTIAAQMIALGMSFAILWVHGFCAEGADAE